MTTKNTLNDALGIIGVFVAAHPEIAPDRLELTVSSILRWLKKKGRPMTKASMEDAWARIVDAVEAMRPEEPEAETPEQEAETERLRKQIDSWSSDQMKEYCKDPAVLAAVENVLNQPRKKEVPKSQPKPQPKPKPKPPVKKDPLEASIDRMSADDFKKTLQDPAKALGIERTLQAAARRGNQ
jgi:hypothetical protein